MKNINLNLEFIRQKSRECSNLAETTKMKILEELEFMEESELYAERISLQEQVVSDPFAETFIWNKTLRGSKFWFEIYEQIDKQ